MMFYPDRFTTDNNFSYRYLKIYSFILIIVSMGVFIYFFIIGKFHIHYIVATGCLWLLFCGFLMGLFSHLATSEKSTELTFEKTNKQVKKLVLVSLGAFYSFGICFFAGLILFAQKSDIWRSSIILFTGSILSLIICIYGLIQRKLTKQHYELKKQQQEIIELLNKTKLKDFKDTSDVLLA